MILQEDVARLRLPEVRPDVILRFGHQGSEYLGTSLIFEKFDTIKPVLDMASTGHDAGPVPLSDSFKPDGTVGFREVDGWDQVVEGADCPVSSDPKRRIRVASIVEDLKLETDRRSFSLVQLGVHEVLDPAVGSFADSEIDLEFEVAETVDGHDVAAIRGLTTT